MRLYRPFSIEHFVKALPKTTKAIAVLDRTKEPGSPGEPLYLDVVNAIYEAKRNGSLSPDFDPTVIGGRYGLSSKEFTPAMVKSVFDELKKSSPKDHFTVGIEDDVADTSLDVILAFHSRSRVHKGSIFGLGADGTVGANKNSIKIIGEETDLYAQGYFVYDSKKAGGYTISHLRFGPNPIRSTYQIDKANFVACHQFAFTEKLNILDIAEEGAIFLLNTPYTAGEVWDYLPRTMQQQIIDKKLRFYVIDAYSVARKKD